MNETPRFCAHCGAPLSREARFCGQCGQSVGAPAGAPASSPISSPATEPVAPAEPVLGFVPTVQRRSGFMGLKAEAFTIMVTPARLVFVPIGSEEMKQAVAEARERAKQAGKGFFGQWGAQLGWLGILHERLATTPVDATLASRPGSFFIPLFAIKRIKIDVDVGDEDSPTTTHLVIDTQADKHSYELTSGNSREVKALLRQVLGDNVK
ncbi:MAG: zinc ribbon domain-containing protein [Anaerolineae bacterium]|nr:zinc ribbon domain-containing protein [Thermoflexales bacterium]MDW8406754.1 zinc ribbon domain-containing protein [Anaerolineae bacterium]